MIFWNPMLSTFCTQTIATYHYGSRIDVWLILWGTQKDHSDVMVWLETSSQKINVSHFSEVMLFINLGFWTHDSKSGASTAIPGQVARHRQGPEGQVHWCEPGRLHVETATSPWAAKRKTTKKCSAKSSYVCCPCSTAWMPGLGLIAYKVYRVFVSFTVWFKSRSCFRIMKSPNQEKTLNNPNQLDLHLRPWGPSEVQELQDGISCGHWGVQQIWGVTKQSSVQDWPEPTASTVWIQSSLVQYTQPG